VKLVRNISAFNVNEDHDVKHVITTYWRAVYAGLGLHRTASSLEIYHILVTSRASSLQIPTSIKLGMQYPGNWEEWLSQQDL
jgi:hypothetical protein